MIKGFLPSDVYFTSIMLILKAAAERIEGEEFSSTEKTGKTYLIAYLTTHIHAHTYTLICYGALPICIFPFLDCCSILPA